MEVLDRFLLNLANEILNPLIWLFFALAVIYFLWGVFKYIINSQSEEERKKGSQHIIWGLVGMAIMMGVYTIIEIVQRSIF